VMSENPRKISEIEIEITFEKNNLSDNQKSKLSKVAEACPVAKSIDPDINQKIKFNF